VNNARAFISIREEFGSFDTFIWGFTNGEVIHTNAQTMEQIPTTSPLSDQVSDALKKRGFKFVGSVTIYAHLQAIGVIDDHIKSCFRSRS
jgi:DNA-3-methyladenine glycosylase I